MNTFETRKEARNSLRGKGLKLVSRSSFSDQDREYWAYGDGSDQMLDHSATITKISGSFYVSDFGRKENA